MKLVLRAVLTISLFALGTSAFAADAGKKGYLVDSQNGVVRSGFGLCWHTGFWTPADAIEECDDVRYDHDKAPKGTTSMSHTIPPETFLSPNFVDASKLVYHVSMLAMNLGHFPQFS